MGELGVSFGCVWDGDYVSVIVSVVVLIDWDVWLVVNVDARVAVGSKEYE